MKKLLIASAALAASVALAQEGTKDFGNLVPNHNFSITQQKTRILDDADVSHFQIKVTPEKEEFVYKVNSVRTPGVFKKEDFKLTVNRKDGKVVRITSEDYASSPDNSGTQGLQTIAMGTDGKVDSLTNCFQDYGFGLLNRKSNKGDFKCMTVNREVCAYLDKEAVDQVLVDQLKSCTETFEKLERHQDRLLDLSGQDNDTNLRALGLKGGFLGFFKSTPKNFYSLSPSTLVGMAGVVQGYGRAVHQCKYLKEKGYLREAVTVEVKPDGEAKDSGSKQ